MERACSLEQLGGSRPFLSDFARSAHPILPHQIRHPNLPLRGNWTDNNNGVLDNDVRNAESPVPTFPPIQPPNNLWSRESLHAATALGSVLHRLCQAIHIGVRRVERLLHLSDSTRAS